MIIYIYINSLEFLFFKLIKCDDREEDEREREEGIFQKNTIPILNFFKYMYTLILQNNTSHDTTT